MQNLTLKRSFLGLLIGLVALPSLVNAQDTIEWFTLGNDHAHTRYMPADQITPENFGDLDVSWEWDGASFGAELVLPTTLGHAVEHATELHKCVTFDNFMISGHFYAKKVFFNNIFMNQNFRFLF